MFEMKFEGIPFSNILDIKLRFSMECKQLASNKINVASIGIEDDLIEESWGMVVVEKHNEKFSIVVKVNIPAKAAIGRYRVDVLLPSASSFILLDYYNIIVVCNPWNKDDDVYLESEELRQEYVLNDVGLIYRGSATNGESGIKPTHWEYGQFEENVLDCVLVLLEKDTRLERQPLKALRKQSSVVWIARVLSAVLNCQQDDGLLVGNWSGEYEDGKAPSSWSSSPDIFQQYYKTNRPVKYGQCWVFAGVMTTALRALGIPSRCVTNFDSAHDTDASMTIDVFESEDGSKIEEMCDDSIWNFHVWNEIWTKRNDLPSKNYDGWNAVDCTPQEKSSQLYQMGPAPLYAIKNGEIYVGYDTGFVFAEVNADYVKWVALRDGSGNIVFEEAKYRNKTYVGKFISTKMVGENKRVDITSLYKNPEGSAEEREAFQNALNFGQGSERRKALLNEDNDENDLEVDLTMNSGTMIENGTDFACTVNVRNISDKNSTLSVTAIVSTMEYTGNMKALVKREKLENITVAAGKDVQKDIVVNADEYVRKLSDLNFMKIVAVVRVQETKKYFIDECKIQLIHAESITIQFLDAVKAGQPTRVEVTFINRLNVHMTNITYSVNGKGLTRTLTEQRRSLGVGQKERIIFRIIPIRAGKHTLYIDIESKEVKDLKSSMEVECQ